MGSSCVVYDRNEYVHRFVPWVYMFTRTESKDAYVQLFEAPAARDLVLRWASLDHSRPIRNALTAVWPDVTIMACWSHISRNVRDKKHLLMEKQLFDDLIYPPITADRRTTLSEMLLEHLGKASERSDSPGGFYANSEWCNWFVNCSGLGGLTPNQNPIESYHNSIKKTAVISLHVTTSWVLNVTLDAIVQHAVFAIHDLVSFHPGQLHNILC
ncbi:TPA: LOW QUALITY PROTEIN: hypothetical protein N0F65_011936 [Lagenidium giganteum]|uniref:MULE transposase domain-containing protein n=1 Tax=Lagenidium giganteum TaxID=4803 RepID=A0AAV2YS27_9STRA|nr:TPA: LOW QUALITY PROTEIN: hypothetical protein N0F65_011936 [Lagenidium giganteum]